MMPLKLCVATAVCLIKSIFCIEIHLVIYKVPKTVVFVNRKKLADKVAIALTIKGIKAWSMNSSVLILVVKFLKNI